MQALTLRAIKGSALSIADHDGNLAGQIIQPGHSLAVGDLVYPDSATTVAKAQADVDATLAAACVAAVAGDTIHLALRPGTVVSVPSHGLGSPGAVLYLSQGTPGAAGAKPGSGLAQPVLYIWTANLLGWIGLPGHRESI